MQSYSERVGQYALRGWYKPDGAQDLTPLHEVVAPHVTSLPADLVESIKRSFYLRNESAADWQARYVAQDWIRAEVHALKAARLDVAFSEEEIDIESEKWAAICRSLGNYEGALSYVAGTGVAVPVVKGTITKEGIYKRFVSRNWWRRQLRKLLTRTAETHLRSIGIVQRRKQLYASDRAVDWRRSRKLRDRELLKELVAISDEGDQLELWGIVEKSNANPAIRRAELMARLRGFEETADAEGHVADFFTLTAPSAFHRTLTNGLPNPLWLQFTIRQAQEWLRKIWARVRARLARLSILFYGFRIAEPHHDGTPHWHMVLFVAEHHREIVRAVIREAWLSEYSEEEGARAHRSKVVAIDRAKGSACGYVSKYIAKNIDGFGVEEDYESEDKQAKAKDSVARVAAWASTHGIRQFQQIGGPSVGLYREHRRLRDSVRLPEIETARVAADEGEFSKFIAAVGGIKVGRHTSIVLDSERTGELTQYGELKGTQVVGLSCATGKVKTRCKAWRIDIKGKARNVPTSELFKNHHSRLKKTKARIVPQLTWKCPTCQKKLWNCRCGLTFSSLSDLGPVSITVRTARTVPTIGGPIKKGPNSTRGSP